MNVGIICNDIKIIDKLKSFPNNTYIVFCTSLYYEKLYEIIDFLISNDCKDIYINSIKDISKIKTKLKQKYKNINFFYTYQNIKSYTENKKIILLNKSGKKIKKEIQENIFDFEKINTTRKDVSPKYTIKRIKTILKKNNYKVKESNIKRNLNGLYSIRLKLNNYYGANGKGISLKYAKASAYAELMERLQSNMLNKKRISTSSINRKQELYEPLLNNASTKYKDTFFTLDDIYFNTEKLLNIKTNKYQEIPINAVNCFCHTNGLSSGNSFEEAVSQGVFEILERYCYQVLLNTNKEIKNIDISKYPLNNTNTKILNKLTKLGYKYYIKDCSIGKYPVLGFLLLNNNKTKYTFTIASDYSLNIALSRCISEMMQGLNLKDLNKKMLNITQLEELEKRYKQNYRSYNWLKCFNNNIGYLSKGFFCDKYIDIKSLRFKDYLTSNDEVISNLKNDIEYDIFIKDFNILGFNTYRVYIPYITTVDCYDIDDLLVNKNYNKLLYTYKNITTETKDNINFFIDVFLKLNKNIKYDELIKPSNLFHLNETTLYFKLDFTSLLIILTILTNRENDMCNLLKFKIDNFNLSNIKITTYKIIINVLSNSTIYNINDKEIEDYIKMIQKNTYKYLKSLKPYYKEEANMITTKKV